MRVLLVTGAYPPVLGGIETFLGYDLVPELRRRGHEVAVITSRPVGARDSVVDVRDGVPVLSTNFFSCLRRPGDLLRARKVMREFLAESAPDVVHLHDVSMLAVFVRELAPARPAFVATVHTVLTRHAPEFVSIARRMILESGAVTGVSSAVAHDVASFVPEARDRLSIVSNGITVPELEDRAPLDPPIVLCVGRLAPEKGFDQAIAAFALLAAQHPTAVLEIAGVGELWSELHDAVRATQLPERIRLLGPVPRADVWSRMRDASVILMPSLYEGLPLVAIEAAFARRPVVASRDAGGLSDVVVDGVTGMLVDREDPAAIARALDHLLRDAGERERLGRAARTRAEDEYSIEACASAYEALYEKVVAARC